MPRKKRPFIDKKKAITFRLVNRSQQDPLITDEKAPQHVLVPVNKRKAEEKPKEETNFPPEKRRQEQAKFGVYFDDDYDYLQHLREPGRGQEVHWEEVPHKHAEVKATKPRVQLPSSVFASEFEEKEGMLMKAAPRSGPRLDWDPEIVEALDDDFDFDDPDNQLEDNFMELAMDGEEDDGDEDWEDDDDSNQADYSGAEDENDELGPLPVRFANFGEDDDDDDNKSRFTEYSMSSSVIRRNEQLTLLDDRFEKFYENYDDPEVGALDCEEIEGHMELQNEMILQLTQDFKKKELPQQYDKAWDVCRLVKLQHKEDAEEEIVELEVEDDDDKKKKWDCESILSTYSNIYNHPKVIDMPKKIKISAKTGLPLVDGDSGKLTEKSLAKLAARQDKTESSGPKSLCAESVLSTLSVLSIRPKDETTEEKRERKKLLKEYRNERRIEKKMNQQAFKEEKLRQQQIDMNIRTNLQGKKIV